MTLMTYVVTDPATCHNSRSTDAVTVSI